MDWTEQQKEAITRRDSGLIVSAAAGSGKTSVLVERLLRILMDESPENKVPADHMIVVTFTNDAAAEMRSRLYQALDQKLQEQPENTWLYQQQIRLQNAHICTISSFCFELIRENLGDQGITAGFRILSETESKMMTSKAADVVLNQWHTDRAEDMQLLWNSFCEKTTPIWKGCCWNCTSFWAQYRSVKTGYSRCSRNCKSRWRILPIIRCCRQAWNKICK